MDKQHVHEDGGHCSRCGRKLSIRDWVANHSRKIIGLLCAICLSVAVAGAELGFTEVANSDQPINVYPAAGIQYIATSTNTSAVAPLDIMMDFTDFHKIEQPRKIENPKENQKPF